MSKPFVLRDGATKPWEPYKPVPRPWLVRLGKGEALTLTACEGDQPGWFHRLMQRAVLGVSWELRK